MLDPAVLRPGRFDRLIYVPSPDLDSLKEIFKIHSTGMPLSADVDLEDLARKAQGYSGADIESVCREAAITALREDINSTEVSRRDFNVAMDRVGPSIATEDDALLPEILKTTQKRTGDCPNASSIAPIHGVDSIGESVGTTSPPPFRPRCYRAKGTINGR